MQYDANSPIWLQVMNLIRMDIVTGKRAPGEKLPGGRDLAVQFSINPNTAARVYRELEDARLVETRRGMGTFVTQDTARLQALRLEMAEKAAREFTDRMKQLGFSKQDTVRLLETED